MYVYILHCSDDTYYTGVTNNLNRRLSEHESGMNEGSYTSKRLPVKLVYHKIFMSPMEAIKYEKQVKDWSRKKKEALINGKYSELQKLAKKNFKKKE